MTRAMTAIGFKELVGWLIENYRHGDTGLSNQGRESRRSMTPKCHLESYHPAIIGFIFEWARSAITCQSSAFPVRDQEFPRRGGP